MKLFVSEYVTGGGWRGDAPTGSLLCEGRAMLSAVLEDAARIPGVGVTTTWDVRLSRTDAPNVDDVEFVYVNNPDEELGRFAELAATNDATWLIAPEFDGILAERRRTVDRVGGRFLGCGLDAIVLTSDKLATARRLEARGVCTVPTETLPDYADAASGLGSRLGDAWAANEFVVKPRSGAGSQDVRLTQAHPLQWVGLPLESREMIVQPFVAGRAASVAALIDERGRIQEFLPPAWQRLSDDGRFRYLGGVVPAFGSESPRVAEIRRVVEAACGAVGGLCGFVGFDFIVPSDGREAVVLVEINPRLTTSYVGYRRLTPGNITERIVFIDREHSPLKWRDAVVSFTSS